MHPFLNFLCCLFFFRQIRQVPLESLVRERDGCLVPGPRHKFGLSQATVLGLAQCGSRLAG